MPTTSPAGPTTRAKSRVKLPGPQATSSTPSPGREPEQQPGDAVLVGHAGPDTPLASRPSAGRHQRS